MSVSVVVPLRSAYALLHQGLERFGIDEPDFTASVLQQIATAVINHNQTWLPQQRLGKVYEQMAQITGCHLDQAAALCRAVDDYIATEIIRLLPDFGASYYRGIVSHAFVPPHDVRIYLKSEVATVAPDAPKAPAR